MPIIHMTKSKEDAEKYGVNVRPYETIVSKFIGKDENGKDEYEDVEQVIWLYDTHVGLCIQDRERNGSWDSDWDMLVWNEEKQDTEWIEFASTRGWSYPCYGSKPDATPEVLQKYHTLNENRRKEAEKLHKEREENMPCKGKTLEVIKGRKVPVGTVGRCFWSNTEFKYDKVMGILFTGYQGRVGIETNEGTRYFTDVSNVKIINQTCN